MYKSTNQSHLLLAFPILYVLLDTLLVVCIKLNTVKGHTSYNTVTANAFTECLKLCIATYAVFSEGSWSELLAINSSIIIPFGLSNLMYAVNNNLFHYSIGEWDFVCATFLRD